MIALRGREKGKAGDEREGIVRGKEDEPHLRNSLALGISRGERQERMVDMKVLCEEHHMSPSTYCACQKGSLFPFSPLQFPISNLEFGISSVEFSFATKK